VLLGAGWRVSKPLSVGVNVGYLWGTFSRSIASSSTTSVNSLSRNYSATIKSFSADFGVQWMKQLNKEEQLTIGATVALGHKLGAEPECVIVNGVNSDTLRAADVLEEYLNYWGLPHGREGNNLWVGCQDWDDRRPTVMLNAHIDTVKPVSTWTRDPFKVMQEGDKLYGLGSNDCGGGLVATLQAYRVMLNRPRTYNI
jgi:hypothetical protein